jgi:hypothetical protein
VHKPSIFTENEIRFLRELVKNHVPFMIVGLSAAALQGAPVVTQNYVCMCPDTGQSTGARYVQMCEICAPYAGRVSGTDSKF